MQLDHGRVDRRESITSREGSMIPGKQHKSVGRRGTVGGIGGAGLGLALGVFLGLVGVSEALAAAECEDPEVLTFSIIPAEESVQELGQYRPIIEHLSETTGKRVEVYTPETYASVIEAMPGGGIDVAVHGPYSYVIANEKDPTIEVFATYAKRPGHLQEEGPGYKSALITKKGSRFRTIESLEGATLALTDPASTSGSLIPQVVFTNEINQPLEDYFSAINYTGAHDRSTLAVYEGTADAAFVATHRFDNVIDRGLVKLEDFNVLWLSPTVPQDPFTYRTTLCADLRMKIEDTFLTLHTRDDAREFLDNVKSNRFVRMTSADYDIIRELKKAKELR